MDLGSIFLILALLVVVSLFISRPFFDQRAFRTSGPVSEEEHELSFLLAERDRLLNALQELDFDYALGKIPEEDYPLQRSVLLQRGADVLRKLDAIEPDLKGQNAEDRIEAMIAARRADAGRVRTAASRAVAAGGPALAEDDLEVLLANRRRQRQEKAAGFCPQCGGPVHMSDQFCPKCGCSVKN